MAIVWFALAFGATCEQYASADQRPAVDAPGLDESSGLAVSRAHDDLYFTHDDGGEPLIYGFDASGALVATYRVPNADLEDWEDMAAAPCPDEGDCLYIGDIGDNDLLRPNVTVYVVREPEARDDDEVELVARYTAIYEGGPRNAEALLVQPCTGRVHVVTKEADGIATVFRLPFNPDGETSTWEEVGAVEVTGSTADAREITGGDWDVDGERVIVRTATQLLEWVSDPEQPNAHWSDPPRVLVAAAEAQGEGVAYDLEGGIVTTSEGAPMPVSIYPCDELNPAEGECVFPQEGGGRCGCASGPAGGSAMWALLVWLGARRRRAATAP